MAKDKTNKKWYSDYNILLNRAAPKICMAGFDCKPAAKCHSISERRILKRIAEDGKVITVAPSDLPGYSTMELRGTGQVSTFSGFCSKHDQELFAPIDNLDYSPENPEQEFLFAYRTIARYHYYKLAWRYSQEAKLAAYKKTRTTGEGPYSVDLNRPLTANELDQLVQMQSNATAQAISESLTLRDFMGALNSAIANKNYSVVSTRILHFPDEYPIGQSVSLIMDSTDHKKRPHVITVNVIPQEGQTYALLSCTSDHGTLCIDRHLEQFRNEGKIDYRAALTHIMCMAGDPIAIKPSYWETLPSELKSSFIERLNVWQHGGIDPVQSDRSFNILRT